MKGKVIKGAILYDGKYITAEAGEIDISESAAKIYEDHGFFKITVVSEHVTKKVPSVVTPALEVLTAEEGEEIQTLEELGLLDKDIELLAENGVTTIDELEQVLDMSALVAMKGIGEATARRILEVAED